MARLRLFANLPQGLSTSAPSDRNRWWNRPSASAAAWSIDPPCYVRKVDRAGHCKDAATIRDKVFCLDPDESTISVYLVASATDLARVAIALNANRSSKTEPLFLLAMTAAELAKIAVRHTPGLTLCMWANHLHCDLLVADVTQVARLADTLVAAGRKQHKFTEKAMQEALAATTHDGCRAADPNSAGCACEDELPKSQWPLWLGRLGRVLRRMLAYPIAWLVRTATCSKPLL